MEDRSKKILTGIAVGAVAIGAAAAVVQLQKTRAQLAQAEKELAALKGGRVAAATPSASASAVGLSSPSAVNKPSASPTSGGALTSPTASASAGAKKKPVRVYMDGVFDLLHYGHANALRQAKAVGDVLVIGLCGDEDVIKNKGSPPVMPEEERYAALKGCKFVQEVIRDAPYDLTEEWVNYLVEHHDIDYIVHGDDPCITADGKDAYAYAKSIGRYKSIKRTEGVSTTDIVGRMLLMTKEHHVVDDSSHAGNAGAGGAGVTTARIERSVRSSSLGSLKDVEDSEGSASAPVASPPAASSSLPPVHSKFLPTARRIMQFADGKAPKPDDKVVYIAGSWDMFNAGHIAALEEARKFGTFLLVGIHEDATVNKLRGHGLPILNLYERTLSLLSCKFVDEVIIGAPYEITEDLVKTMNISVVVHGSVSDSTNAKGHEYLNWPYNEGEAKASIEAAYRVPREMGILKTFESPRALTALDIVERILAARATFQKRYEKKSAMETAYYTKDKEYVQEA